MVCDKECQDNIMSIASGIAGTFTVLTIAIALTQIIIIILMAPFYSLTSFCTIVFQDTQGYFALVRDIYEAVLIYSFFNLLALYLAYDPQTKDVDYNRIYECLATKDVTKHLWPMNYFKIAIYQIIYILQRETRAKWFFRQARLYILQYLAIKPAAALLFCLAYAFGQNSVMTLFLKTIVCLSVCFSLYYLVLFYQLLKEELAFARPLLKFISIKGILFFTFWQDFVIDILKPQITSHFSGLSPEAENYVIEVCENLLVCFEMVILTVMSTIAFSHQGFKETEKYNIFVKSYGVEALTKKLVSTVLKDNFVTAFEDLKELKEPLKDTFKSYKDSQIEQSDMMMMISSKEKEGFIDDDVFMQFKVNIIEKPQVIPNFIDIGEEDSLL